MSEKQTKSLTELSETELAQKHLEPSTPEEIAASTENVIAMLEEPLKAAREERAALEAEKAEQFEYNRTLLEFAAFDILPDDEVSRFCEQYKVAERGLTEAAMLEFRRLISLRLAEKAAARERQQTKQTNTENLEAINRILESEYPVLRKIRKIGCPSSRLRAARNQCDAAVKLLATNLTFLLNPNQSAIIDELNAAN